MTEVTTVSRDDIRRHISGPYINLRMGMGILAITYPILLYVWGAAHEVPLARSISHYYWETVELGSPVRVWMVGGLFAIGVALFLYQGFTKGENYALNIGGILALGVALFPTEINCEPNCQKITLHGICAVGLFICLIYVTWFRAKDTLKYLHNETEIIKFRHMYNAAGAAMLASPLAAVILQSVLGQSGKHIFFIEAAGVWAFAAYWFIKTAEMRKSGADKPPSGAA